jgi:hypothetical protein
MFCMLRDIITDAIVLASWRMSLLIQSLWLIFTVRIKS